MNHKEYFQTILDICESLLELNNIVRVKKLRDLVLSKSFWEYVDSK